MTAGLSQSSRASLRPEGLPRTACQMAPVASLLLLLTPHFRSHLATTSHASRFSRTPLDFAHAAHPTLRSRATFRNYISLTPLPFSLPLLLHLSHAPSFLSPLPSAAAAMTPRVGYCSSPSISAVSRASASHASMAPPSPQARRRWGGVMCHSKSACVMGTRKGVKSLRVSEAMCQPCSLLLTPSP